MRGGEVRSGSLFSYVDLEGRVPQGHPLRAIRTVVDEALARLNDDFEAIYAPIGRPSIPPSSCCGRCCCRRSIPCARSGN